MSFINWKLPVADKEIFWDTLKTHNGWKLQHNTVFGQYRVISPSKYREAWGIDRNELEADFKHLSGYSEKPRVAEQPKQAQAPQSSSPSQMTSSRDDLYKELERLAELFERSAITEQEFQELRQIVLQKLKSTP